MKCVKSLQTNGKRGVKAGLEFAMLTDVITKGWSDKTVKEYKQHKGLKKENLRDNMTNLELVLNMLSETTTKTISQQKRPKTFNQSKTIAAKGGAIAGNARKSIELETSESIVSSKWLS